MENAKNVKLTIVKSSDFETSNRFIFKGWDFSTKALDTYRKMDRFFYLHYSKAFLDDVEKARESRTKSQSRFKLKFKQKVEESQFITEYLGIDGRNKMSGHREKMTQKIHKVYKALTGVDISRSNDAPKRDEVDSTILAEPFAGLEVAFQLVEQLQKQRDLSTQGMEILSKQLITIYENEILKWSWYWIVASYSTKDDAFFDIFQLFGQKSKISGSFASKIGRLVTYVDRIINTRVQQYIRWLLLAFLTLAYDSLIKNAAAVSDPEKLEESKDLIRMMCKPIIDKIDSKAFKEVKLRPDEELITAGLYTFHKKRLPLSVKWVRQHRNDDYLAWIFQIMPDSIMYSTVNLMNEEWRRTTFNALSNIAKNRKISSEMDTILINKLDKKLKKKDTSSPASAAPTKERPKKAPKEERQSSGSKPEVPAAQGNIEDTEFQKTLVRPFVLGVMISDTGYKITCASILQFLHAGNKELFNALRSFLLKTKQKNVSDEMWELIWNDRKQALKDNPLLSPMEKIWVDDVVTELQQTGVINWEKVVDLIGIKLGASQETVNTREKKLHAFINRQINGQGQKLSDLLHLDEKKIRLATDQLENKGVLKSAGEKQNLVVCWAVMNYI